MLGLGAATRIYVATGATDMRLGFNGLFGLVRDRLACDALSGHLYLFANARRDRMKVLFFDGSGPWVCAKRMEGGTFQWIENLSMSALAIMQHSIRNAVCYPR
jgi:transposase